jgi:hypothetical protein
MQLPCKANRKFKTSYKIHLFAKKQSGGFFVNKTQNSHQISFLPNIIARLLFE